MLNMKLKKTKVMQMTVVSFLEEHPTSKLFIAIRESVDQIT